MSYLKYIFIDNKGNTKVFFTHKHIYTKPKNLEVTTEKYKIIYVEEVMSYDPDKKYCQQIEDAVLNESIFTLDQNVTKCIGYVDADSTGPASYLILESICTNLEEELTNRLQDRYFQCSKCNRLIRDFADNFFVINAEEVCTRCTRELVEKLDPEINNKQYIQHHGILNVTFPFIPDEDVIFNKSRSWDKVGTYNKTDEDILKATKIAEDLVQQYGIYVETTNRQDTFTIWKKAKKIYKYELEDLYTEETQEFCITEKIDEADFPKFEGINVKFITELYDYPKHKIDDYILGREVFIDNYNFSEIPVVYKCTYEENYHHKLRHSIYPEDILKNYLRDEEVYECNSCGKNVAADNYYGHTNIEVLPNGTVLCLYCLRKSMNDSYGYLQSEDFIEDNDGPMIIDYEPSKNCGWERYEDDIPEKQLKEFALKKMKEGYDIYVQPTTDRGYYAVYIKEKKLCLK